MNGKFITIEGCEGVGKTTQVRLLKEYLESTNQDCIFLREPGGTKISEDIRKIILDVNNKEMADECETMLYTAARAQLVKQVIKPALAEGKIVVCDRFIDSTFAYQGVARGLGADYANNLNLAACRGVLPDVTIFLDLNPIEAFKRKGGADTDDRLEQAGMDFHMRVYDGYKLAQKMYPERIVSIYPTGTKEETSASLISYLKDNGFIK